MMVKAYMPAIALLAFGYPMTTIMAQLAGLPVETINVALKGFYMGLFLLSLMGSFLRRSAYVPILLLPLLFFFFVFGFRLIVDILIRDIVAPFNSPARVLGYFFLLTVMPALAIILAYERKDLEPLGKWIFAVLFASGFMVLIYFLQQGTQLIVALAQQRLSVRDQGEATAILSPITIGLCGAALSLYSIVLLSTNSGASRMRLAFLTVGLLLGLLSLTLAGSRGPILAFAVGLLFYLASIFAIQFKSGHVRRKVSKRIYLVIPAIGSGVLYAISQSDTMFLALTRLVATLSGDSNSGPREVRFDIAADAIDGFLRSPFVGSSYLALDGTAYPHNAILEALMATGVAGGIAFLVGLFLFFSKAWKALTMQFDPRAFPIALVTIALVTMSMFSLTLSQAPEIWLMVFLVLTIAARSESEAAWVRQTTGHMEPEQDPR